MADVAPAQTRALALGLQQSRRLDVAVKAFAQRCFRLASLAWRGFNADLCPLWASALTLYSLLSVVPVFAMLLGIAKGFGIEELLRERLFEQFREQREIAVRLMDFAQSLLDKTQGGLVAGVGVAVLFWSVMSVFGHIERAFNHIWKVPEHRSLSRKISDYLSMLLLAPVLLTMAGSMAVYAQSHLAAWLPASHLPFGDTQLLIDLFGYLPLLLIWLLFSITLIFMPNTHVAWQSGIWAGILTGTAFQLAQWAYISLQIGVSSYNAVYGSFAALPLFIVSLQTGWLILLFGAELAFYHQHFAGFDNGTGDTGAFAQKKIAALRIAHWLVQRFANAQPAPDALAIAKHLRLPVSLVQSVLSDLLRAQLLAELHGDPPAYQPARDIGLLYVADILDALELPAATPSDQAADPILATHEQLQQALRACPANRLLKDL